MKIQWPDMLKIFSDQNLITHIYPTTKIRKLPIRNVIAHDYIPQYKLNKVMNTYDYGLYTASYNHEKNNLYMKTSIGNKLFSYFEAGIPVVVLSNYEYIAHLIKKYNCGVVIKEKDLPNLKKILEKQNYRQLLEGVDKIRKEITIEKYLTNLKNKIIELS